MPTGIWSLDFAAQNSQRAYPLSDNSTKIDQTGAFTLPDSFLIYLDYPVSTGLNVDPSQFFLYQLGNYTNGFSLVLGYQPASGSPVPVATALIPTNLHTPGTRYALGGVGDYADSVGSVVIGNLADILLQPPGLFTFDLTGSRLEPDAVRPIIAGIASLSVTSGTQQSISISGDISFVAGPNMQISVVEVEGQIPTITFSAINGEGTVNDCVCVDDTIGVPIQTINGIPPTSNGSFYLLGSDCVSFTPITNGIQVNDTCSKPCCDCQELASITSQLETLNAQAATLQAFVNRLDAAVEVMNLTVLGSKLNDQGCGAD